MSETVGENPDYSPNTTTDWSVLEGDYNKESDVNQVSTKSTGEQFKKATMDVIAAREELFYLSDLSRENPEDDEVRQATREQSVLVQALIERRNELANKRVNERPAE